MTNHHLWPEKSLLFAPMEGITDGPYRMAVMQAFPEWDKFACDFLRVPTEGHYQTDFILKHFGLRAYRREDLREKTIFQILTTARANTEYTVQQVKDLGFGHLDLNLGCPSRKVNSHGGGAFLLHDLESLKKIIQDIRKVWPTTFTVKMRVGYKSDENFIEALKILEAEGVDGITVHGRTRDELYKGVADWKYFSQGCDSVNIPFVGNGDIWTAEDIDHLFKNTNCHSLMLARGALKTPWLASDYKNQTNSNRREMLMIYFSTLEEEYRIDDRDEEQILKRFKALSRYCFDEYNLGEVEYKRSFLRVKSLNEFKTLLANLPVE